MESYTVTHLRSGEAFSRPKLLPNPHLKATQSQAKTNPDIETFHQSLPQYGETILHSLPTVAAELGVSHVLLKDESTRFGLPSFKIAGASWAMHQMLCQHLRLPPSATLASLQDALKGREDVSVVTCSEGNWGRAVARMSKYFGIKALIYVPGFMPEYTRNLIRSEGAELVVCEDGSYDDSVAATIKCSNDTKALLVMDTSFEGYEQIPRWVTDGYSTIMTETDRQVAALTDGNSVDLATCSVGVGSWAHSVVEHYRGKAHPATLVSVEPDTAAGLKESLHTGSITPVKTADTIMAGMNCGTTSHIAWPVLEAGVGMSVAVGDKEAHECVLELQRLGINAGPCGAANLAALRILCGEHDCAWDRQQREGKVAVIFSTEGGREYEVPK